MQGACRRLPSCCATSQLACKGCGASSAAVAISATPASGLTCRARAWLAFVAIRYPGCEDTAGAACEADVAIRLSFSMPVGLRATAALPPAGLAVGCGLLLPDIGAKGPLLRPTSRLARHSANFCSTLVSPLAMLGAVTCGMGSMFITCYHFPCTHSAQVV